MCPVPRHSGVNESVSPRDLHKPLLDSLSTAIILVDGDLLLRHMNPAAEALLSMSCERNIGEPITYFFHESNETEKQLKLAAVQANHYTKRHAEWQLLSGGHITVDYTVTPFGDHEGLIIEILPIDRLLRISRGDETPLSGFDEKAFAAAAESERRPLASLLEDFQAVRASTLRLIDSVPGSEWTRRGVAAGSPVTARGLVYIMAGHVEHHFAILRERYDVAVPA